MAIDNECERKCETTKEIREHLAEPHYVDECPHPDWCEVHFDTDPFGHIVNDMFNW